MLKEQKFFICNTCGNIVGMVFDSGVNVVCCGEEMEELVPNTVEASVEKHLPVVEIEGNLVKVNVGSADHPMIPEHYIRWFIQTEKGGQRKNLSPGGPECGLCTGKRQGRGGLCLLQPARAVENRNRVILSKT